jgi:hypothetical protein
MGNIFYMNIPPLMFRIVSGKVLLRLIPILAYVRLARVPGQFSMV